MSLKNVDRYRLALALTRAVNLIHTEKQINVCKSKMSP